MREVLNVHKLGLAACLASLIAYVLYSRAVPIFWHELIRLIHKV